MECRIYVWNVYMEYIYMEYIYIYIVHMEYIYIYIYIKTRVQTRGLVAFNGPTQPNIA